MRYKTVIILGLLLIIVYFTHHFYQKSRVMATYKSPDGKYELIIKRDRNIFTPTMPGDGGIDSTPIVLLLKDTKGKMIAISSDKPECNILFGNLKIEWKLENAMVKYATARYIKLDTGEILC